ncbi:MAG TPA: copper amine oxidase N-terminal domain-containing protein [Candidatus Monoglobus merdigallinarum]|uniref:Copper amine oxidase N-terminal domain-containing protein n=1 Tax=Candidatus Monoglobus merdigallinarum TaxID=2838698 RepID=A0A9D1TKU9_9FIRM|nr:copper amine oxidase N-terminal domain-containing protein [Candidatus Monoglobus merdigallinarum]
MKKILSVLLLSAALLSSVSVFADEAVSGGGSYVEYANVIVNGKAIEFDVQPRIINGRTMVPMRAIFEELGADVEWIEADELILSTKGYKLISMKIGNPVMYIADISQGLNTSVELETAPYLENDSRTMVPLRAVSEALDASVEWDEATYTVTVTL